MVHADSAIFYHSGTRLLPGSFLRVVEFDPWVDSGLGFGASTPRIFVVGLDDFDGMPPPRIFVYLQKYWKSRLPLEAFGYTTTEFRDLVKKSSYVKDAVRHGIVLFNSD